MPRAISLLCLAAAASLGGCAALRPLVADAEHHSARFNLTCEIRTQYFGTRPTSVLEHRWFAIDLERGTWAEADGSNRKAIIREKGDSISRLYGWSEHSVQQWLDLSSGRFDEKELIADPAMLFRRTGDCRRPSASLAHDLAASRP